MSKLMNQFINAAKQEIAEQCEPCPFCGETPNITQIGSEQLQWVIECKDMGCIFKRSAPNHSLDNLLADWNKREGNQFWINV